MSSKHRVLYRDPGPLKSGFSQNGADDVLYNVCCILNQETSAVLAIEHTCPPEIVHALYDIGHYFKLNSIVMCHSVSLLQRLVFTPVAIDAATLPLVVALAAKLYRRDTSISLKRIRTFLTKLGQPPQTNRELFITEQRILAALNFDVECNTVPELIGTLLGAIVWHPISKNSPLAQFDWGCLFEPSLDMAVIYFVKRHELPDRLRSFAKCVVPAIIIVAHMFVERKTSPYDQLVKILCALVLETNEDAMIQDALCLLTLFSVNEPNKY